MLRKVIYEHGLVTDGWISFDPADTGVISKFSRRTSAREKKGSCWLCCKTRSIVSKCMSFQRPNGKKGYFKRRKIGFLRKIASGFSLLKISVKPYSYTRITSVRDYSAGRKLSVRYFLF